MTVLTEPELTKIANNQFTMDFGQAKLVQQGTANPRIYEGPGSIFQDENGMLQLKLYSQAKDSEELITGLTATLSRLNLPRGQLVGEDYYYSFEGVDLYGHTWTATDIAIDLHTGVTAGGRVIYASRIVHIQSQSASAHGGNDEAVLVVPGSYRIPFTDGQPGTQEEGRSACTLELGNTITANLKTKDGALVVNLRLVDPNPDVYMQRVLGSSRFQCNNWRYAKPALA